MSHFLLAFISGRGSLTDLMVLFHSFSNVCKITSMDIFDSSTFHVASYFYHFTCMYYTWRIFSCIVWFVLFRWACWESKWFGQEMQRRPCTIQKMTSTSCLLLKRNYWVCSLHSSSKQPMTSANLTESNMRHLSQFMCTRQIYLMT